MVKIQDGNIIESSYVIEEEGKNASLFGIGNGYFGIRGSFEEFGDNLIQGCYVRGVFDHIIENPQTYSVNKYMKRYYFDAEKAKEFEYEDSCINIGDIQAFRIYIDKKLFLPWDYEILEYERKFDFSSGGLTRRMKVRDEKGNETLLSFYKSCSFFCNHVFFQEMKIEKLNHNLPIEVRSGIDFMVKTMGQKKSVPTILERNDDYTYIHSEFGDHYHMSGDFYFQNETEGYTKLGFDDSSLFYSDRYLMNGKEATIKKKVLFYANIDDFTEKDVDRNLSLDYRTCYLESSETFKKIFKDIDVLIEGNDELDSLIRYSNYQTLIGFDRIDSVHSLSAKNLTSEKYNQFVWWDCEIYQLPYFLIHFPKESRSILEYRYRCLNQAKENAKSEGYKGAKFAFCSSVTGAEQVWIYARHPFLQIHINSDVAYGILNYYKHTHDSIFMKEMGMEMIEEILLYFISRSTFFEGQYHLLNVTGTDEHHDYVNDDAYTNYSLHYVLSEFIKLIDEFDYPLKNTAMKELIDYKEKLFLPQFHNRILPQFDGYLSLSENTVLDEEAKNFTPGFQMKQPALYHLCQTIKQPDVLLLYSYLDIGMKDNYKENYEFYLTRCEASSSLTYPVHAIAAIDNDDEEEFKKNLYSSLRIDIDDLHSGAKEGIHAGCLTGGYLALFRGLLGIQIERDYIKIHPHHFKDIKGLKLSFRYHQSKIDVEYNSKEVVLKSDEKFDYEYAGSYIRDVKEVRLVY